MGKHVQIIFENAHQYHHGRWFFIAVKYKQDIEDIKKLLLRRDRPTKLLTQFRVSLNKNSLWKTGYKETKIKEVHFWIALAICRVFKQDYED